ncbi:MAG: hypothetical protein P3C12_13805 [Gemmatimonadota bacterium]|nr:hypothetical protein [Gemmatimonadota bacterium]
MAKDPSLADVVAPNGSNTTGGRTAAHDAPATLATRLAPTTGAPDARPTVPSTR